MFLTIVQAMMYVLAAGAFIAASLFLSRTLNARNRAAKKFYGVERQGLRQQMLVNGYYTAGVLVVAIVFLGIGWWVGALGQNEAEAIATSPSPTVEQQEPATETPASPQPTTNVTTPTALPDRPTTVAQPPTATPPAITPIAPQLPTAIVNSPVVGLYLRIAPAGEIVERLEDRALVTVLEGQQVVQEIEWLNVRAESGNEGWVAAEFLELSTAP